MPTYDEKKATLKALYNQKQQEDKLPSFFAITKDNPYKQSDPATQSLLKKLGTLSANIDNIMQNEITDIASVEALFKEYNATVENLNKRKDRIASTDPGIIIEARNNLNASLKIELKKLDEIEKNNPTYPRKFTEDYRKELNNKIYLIIKIINNPDFNFKDKNKLERELTTRLINEIAPTTQFKPSFVDLLGTDWKEKNPKNATNLEIFNALLTQDNTTQPNEVKTAEVSPVENTSQLSATKKADPTKDNPYLDSDPITQRLVRAINNTQSGSPQYETACQSLHERKKLLDSTDENVINAARDALHQSLETALKELDAIEQSEQFSLLDPTPKRILKEKIELIIKILNHDDFNFKGKSALITALETRLLNKLESNSPITPSTPPFVTLLGDDWKKKNPKTAANLEIFNSQLTHINLSRLPAVERLLFIGAVTPDLTQSKLITNMQKEELDGLDLESYIKKSNSLETASKHLETLTTLIQKIKENQQRLKNTNLESQWIEIENTIKSLLEEMNKEMIAFEKASADVDEDINFIKTQIFDEMTSQLNKIKQACGLPLAPLDPEEIDEKILELEQTINIGKTEINKINAEIARSEAVVLDMKTKVAETDAALYNFFLETQNNDEDLLNLIKTNRQQISVIEELIIKNRADVAEKGSNLMKLEKELTIERLRQEIISDDSIELSSVRQSLSDRIMAFRNNAIQDIGPRLLSHHITTGQITEFTDMRRRAFQPELTAAYKKMDEAFAHVTHLKSQYNLIIEALQDPENKDGLSRFETWRTDMEKAIKEADEQEENVKKIHEKLAQLEIHITPSVMHHSKRYVSLINTEMANLIEKRFGDEARKKFLENPQQYMMENKNLLSPAIMELNNVREFIIKGVIKAEDRFASEMKNFLFNNTDPTDSPTFIENIDRIKMSFYNDLILGINEAEGMLKQTFDKFSTEMESINAASDFDFVDESKVGFDESEVGKDPDLNLFWTAVKAFIKIWTQFSESLKLVLMSEEDVAKLDARDAAIASQKAADIQIIKYNRNIETKEMLNQCIDEKNTITGNTEINKAFKKTFTELIDLPNKSVREKYDQQVAQEKNKTPTEQDTPKEISAENKGAEITAKDENVDNALKKTNVLTTPSEQGESEENNGCEDDPETPNQSFRH
ncbi:MAG: hypothetical protein NTW08_04140 [Gammaproteobacteria bacterium]|nr:hypothetical protein [Gammaproteobacteria bacterium]